MDFIAAAFRAARAADPNAKLYANDFNIEGPGAKATAYQNLIKTLKSQQVPIDGIGMQAHFIVGELPGNIQQNIQAFVNLGVEVAITELDVRMTLPATSALLAQQQKDYQTIITACANVPKCVGVTLWDFTDKFSWVPGTFAGQGAACPWDQVKKSLFVVSRSTRANSRVTLAEPGAETSIPRDCQWVQLKRTVTGVSTSTC